MTTLKMTQDQIALAQAVIEATDACTKAMAAIGDNNATFPLMPDRWARNYEQALAAHDQQRREWLVRAFDLHAKAQAADEAKQQALIALAEAMAPGHYRFGRYAVKRGHYLIDQGWADNGQSVAVCYVDKNRYHRPIASYGWD